MMSRRAAACAAVLASLPLVWLFVARDHVERDQPRQRAGRYSAKPSHLLTNDTTQRSQSQRVLKGSAPLARASLGGHVRSSAGLPLAGLVLRAYARGTVIGRHTTDGRGHFSIPLHVDGGDALTVQVLVPPGLHNGIFHGIEHVVATRVVTPPFSGNPLLITLERHVWGITPLAVRVRLQGFKDWGVLGVTLFIRDDGGQRRVQPQSRIAGDTLVLTVYEPGHYQAYLRWQWNTVVIDFSLSTDQPIQERTVYPRDVPAGTLYGVVRDRTTGGVVPLAQVRLVGHMPRIHYSEDSTETVHQVPWSVSTTTSHTGEFRIVRPDALTDVHLSVQHRAYHAYHQTLREPERLDVALSPLTTRDITIVVGDAAWTTVYWRRYGMAGPYGSTSVNAREAVLRQLEVNREYELVVMRDWCVGVQQRVVVSHDDAQISLGDYVRAGRIRVHVINGKTRRPLTGVHVGVRTCREWERPFLSGTTNAMGSVLLDNIPEGVHHVSLRYQGFRAEDVEVRVVPGEYATLGTIELWPAD